MAMHGVATGVKKAYVGILSTSRPLALFFPEVDHEVFVRCPRNGLPNAFRAAHRAPAPGPDRKRNADGNVCVSNTHAKAQFVEMETTSTASGYTAGYRVLRPRVGTFSSPGTRAEATLKHPSPRALASGARLPPQCARVQYTISTGWHDARMI